MECFHLYFLENLTFYENHTVISCKKGETRYYCGNFRLIFDKGVISHLKLKSHFARFHWSGSMVESLEENIPKRVIAPIFPLEQDDEQLELETQEAGNWLFREDLIQTVGVAVGFCVFLLVLGRIIYLKCGNKRGGSVLVPFYNAQTQSVDLGTSRGGYGQLESYRHIIQPQPDEPADPAATAQPASNPARLPHP